MKSNNRLFFSKDRFFIKAKKLVSSPLKPIISSVRVQCTKITTVHTEAHLMVKGLKTFL